MDLSSLTPQQTADLANRLAPMLGYLTRLTDRMQKRGWKSSDPAYVAAWAARDAVHELHVRVRYASCGPGTAGKPSSAPGQEPRPWEPGGRGARGGVGHR